MKGDSFFRLSFQLQQQESIEEGEFREGTLWAHQEHLRHTCSHVPGEKPRRADIPQCLGIIWAEIKTVINVMQIALQSHMFISPPCAFFQEGAEGSSEAPSTVLKRPKVWHYQTRQAAASRGAPESTRESPRVWECWLLSSS